METNMAESGKHQLQGLIDIKIISWRHTTLEQNWLIKTHLKLSGTNITPGNMHGLSCFSRQASCRTQTMI